MSKHTPGPWAVREHWSDKGCFEVFLDRSERAIGQWSAFAEVTDYIHKKESAEANAYLIAAAPDLLEALKVIVDNGGIGSKDMFDDARAAIAKATGTEDA